jgi:hypothetical protein
MRFFLQVFANLPTTLIMNRVMHCQNLFQDDNGVQYMTLRNELRDTPAMGMIPAAKSAALALLQGINGTALGRVYLTRLAPKTKVAPAIEENTGYSRYFVVLGGGQNALYTAGDESVDLRTGDAWYVDASQPGMIVNNSGDDALLLIVDLRID